MAIGDIKIQSLKIGKMQPRIAGFNIYEDILNPYGPLAEIRVIDPSDDLGQKNVSGSFNEDVEINFSGDDNIASLGSGSRLKLKMYKNTNVNDMSINNTGSGHHKQYDIRCVPEEFLNAQGNYIEKSFKGKTSDVVKHVVEKGFKSKKQFNASNTKGNRQIVIPKSHPLDVLNKMNNEHISDKYDSSVFTLFQKAGEGGEYEYHFKTFEELFEQGPVVNLKQTTTLSFKSSPQEKQNSILWFKPSANFFSGPRALSKTTQTGIDMTSHKIWEVKDQQQEPKFKAADNSKIYNGKASYSGNKSATIGYVQDKANSQDKHETSKAKTNRAAFLAELSQTSAELEVYYNPKITLGSMIQLDIPQKADKSEGGEKQWNGKCLVVAIRTKYRVSREPPNCTMVLRVVKGNSYKEGGGGEA